MSESNYGEDRVAEFIRAHEARATDGRPSRAGITRIVGGAQRGLARRKVWRRGVRVVGGALALLGLVLSRPLWQLDDGRPASASAPPQVRAGEQLTSGKKSRTIDLPGGQLTLAPESSVGMRAITSAGATAILARGRVDARVTPSSDPTRPRDWHVLAGPFDVRVVGTIFRVDWQPEATRLTVTVQRGEVEVTGPGVSPPKRVIAGGSFVAVVPPASGAQGEQVTPAPLQPAAPNLDTASKKRRASPPDWKKLADAGDYAGSISAAEVEGFDSLTRRLSLGELMRLADIARLAGDLKKASVVLHRVRGRAPGSTHAALAAYSLATMAFDQQHDLAQAARWFGVYLRESPNGSLAREALGRKLEAEQRLGRKDAALRSAKQYLKNHPNGWHREFAQGVLRTQK